MSDICRRLQDILAERGPTALRDDEAAQRHLEECNDCFAVLDSLAALDAGFEALPRLDAPDELVEALLARDELRPATPDRPDSDRETVTPAKRSWIRTVGNGIHQLFGPGRPRLKAAVAFALLAAISMPVWVHFQTRRRAVVAMYGFDATSAETWDRRSAAVVRDRANISPASVPGDTPSSEAPEQLEKQQLEQLQALGYLSGAGRESGWKKTDTSRTPATPRPVLADPIPSEPGLSGAQEARAEELRRRLGADSGDLPIWVGTQADVTFRGGSPRIESDVSGPFDDDTDARQRVRDRLRERLKSLPRGLQDADGGYAEDKAKNEPAEDLPRKTVGPDPLALARSFLTERDEIDARGQPADGYWSNTYVPGDPVLRHLQARLAGRDRSLLAPNWRNTVGGEPPALHGAARRTTQPFDSPANAALGIQLQADRGAIRGETRMLVQVGLAATPRHGGRRPAMNVAVVLDLGGDPADSGRITPETGASLVALSAAFGEARDLGDRFRLIAAGRSAGRGSGEIVAPEDFRRGPLVVAVGSLLATEATGSEQPLGLVEAVRSAIAAVAGGDDPAAPLGSSAVIVATTRALTSDAEGLGELAHESAVAGIPLSVVGVGDAVDLAELDRLALAGQGSRRLLDEPAAAPALVDRELAAVSRAVARAVRLRIRLAPGVRLIDVVGAHRYGAAAAERVRQTERAIDQRLARNLGIEADRGDDEAGIQIVIPTFYAGDHHAVLLDVVASGPGPIADVTARFKDLVQLENGVASARLDLARGEAARGPLERNVLENLLAYRLHRVLEGAAVEVALGDPENAAIRIEQHRRLLVGLKQHDGFSRDRDLAGDVAMLDGYLRLLRGQWPRTPELRLYLAESMHYAALLKVLPEPIPIGS